MSKKRLQRELQRLPFEHHLESNEDQHEILVLIEVDSTDYLVSMSVDTTVYPFRPPHNVMLNNKCYHRLLTIDLLRKSYKRCLCCNSLLCDAWVPTYTLQHLLKEIQDISKLHAAREFLCLKVIKRKYLFQDAPIKQFIQLKTLLN